MGREHVRDMLDKARRGGYAVGYFESWNLESLQGTLDAAEQSRSPIIIGFNGDFLSRSSRVDRERLPLYAALVRAAADNAAVPCATIFNECPQDDWVNLAATLGFGLVMPADPGATPEQQRKRVAAVVSHAHRLGVAVEGEIGELPNGSGGSGGNGHNDHHGSQTDPELAARFVADTGVDFLAVSVGNVHIQLNGQSDLDLDRLAKIRDRVSLPLVLHGGTGISPQSLRQAIGMGVVKVNYGTYIKQRYLAAVRRALSSNQADPHELLGIGSAQDVMSAGRAAVRDAVLERIPLLGCEGKA